MTRTASKSAQHIAGVFLCWLVMPMLAIAQEPPQATSGELPNGTVVNVDPQGSVTLHADNTPLATVLRAMSVMGKRNIVATPAVRGSVTANIYNVPFEEALDAVLLPNQAGYRKSGNFIYVYTNEELAAMAAAATPMRSKVFTLNHITAADALALVEPLKSADGTIAITPAAEAGISSSAEDAGGNTMAGRELLIVYDYAANIDAIADVIAEIDVRPKQVLIEATILRAQISEDNALGVDFTVTGGVDLELLNSQSQGVTNLTVGDLPQDRFGNFNSRLETDFTGAVPAGGATFGVIKDHVAVFVRALEGIADTTVIANPKVLALNKQRGEVIVGRQDGYPVIVTTETTTQQTTQLLETGTRLLFRPFIGDDGYIRMELHPEDSRGEVVGDQPQKETTEVTTNVMIKDGQTILIGGLFRESTRDSRGQLPLLGNIPGVGTLFRSTRDTTDREEVIILLTVHIVKDEAYAAASLEELERVERIRVGARRGIQWFGRERLAQDHYRKALEHYAAGEDEDALWDVRMALHNNPRFHAAQLLKEKLLNRRDWDDEGSTTRTFIYRLIAEERGESVIDYGRPAPPFTRAESPADPDSAPSEQE